MYLNEEDLNAMYFSMENRSPYLDRSLFEFANLIPTKYLIQKGSAKAVLREAMRGIVPNVVLDYPVKTGFNAPISAFLDRENPEIWSYFLNDSPIYDHVKKQKIQALINKPNLLNSESKFLFSFLNAKLFLEAYS